MADESIKITIGAAKTASVDRVFADIRKQAARTGQDLNRFLDPKRAMKGLEAYQAKLKEIAGVARANGPLVSRHYDAEGIAAERSARRQEAAYRFVHNTRMRGIRQEESAQRRAEAAQQRNMERFARMTSHRATRFLWPNVPALSVAKRLAMEVSRGVGLDLSPSSMIARGVGLETAAVKLSNTSFIAGDSRNGTRQAPASLMKVAREIGAKTGRDPEEVIAALDAFKKPTGDLKSGLEVNERLATLGASQGMDLSELYGTAGNITKAIRKQVAPDQVAGVLDEIMRNVIHQGMVGSVEAEDISKYGGKITAGALGYEGNIVDNLKKRFALAQVAMEFGGATSAAGAATAVERLDSTFETNARVEEFKAKGISVMGAGGKKRDAIEIIKDSVEKTMGDPVAFNKLFMNILGAKAGKGLQTVYRTASDANGGSKEAGRQAIDDYIRKLTGGTLTDERVKQDMDAVRSTTAFKANELNVRLQERVMESFTRLAPQLERMIPHLERAVNAISTMVEWIAEDPITRTIEVSIAAAIGRAGIESTFRLGLEKMLTGGQATFNQGMVQMTGTMSAVVPLAIATAIAESLDMVANKDRGGDTGKKEWRLNMFKDADGKWDFTRSLPQMFAGQMVKNVDTGLQTVGLGGIDELTGREGLMRSIQGVVRHPIDSASNAIGDMTYSGMNKMFGAGSVDPSNTTATEKNTSAIDRLTAILMGGRPGAVPGVSGVSTQDGARGAK